MKRVFLPACACFALAFLFQDAVVAQDADFKTCRAARGHAEQISACSRAIASGRLSHAELADAFAARGRAYLNAFDVDKAQVDLTEAIRLRPRDKFLYLSRALVWQRKHDLDREIREYDEVLNLDPKYVSAFLGRGRAHYRKGDMNAALADYSDMLRAEPDDYNGLVGRADVMRRLGDYGAAIRDYEEAVRLGPNAANAHGRLAWLLATALKPEFRNAERALQLARRANELDLVPWSSTTRLEELAAAYAEAGKFDEAVGIINKALAIGGGYPSMYFTAESARQRLELYRSRKPYREP